MNVKQQIGGILFLLLFACKEIPKQHLDIPWLVQYRIQDDRSVSYQYADSLARYATWDTTQIENLANYYSYLANLQYAVDPQKRELALQYLEQAFTKNSSACCEALIAKTYQYIKPNGRPLRRYNMPFILDLDLEYFIDRLKYCRQRQKITPAPLSEEEALQLRMSYVLLKDQWFRIPSRANNAALQAQYDRENRKALEQWYKQFSFSSEDKEMRQDIFTLLLHSTDCEWTAKWLKIYLRTYGRYERYEEHLQHFLWRSSCQESTIQQIVKTALASSTK